MPDDIVILPLQSFQEMVGPHCNPFLTISATKQGASGELVFTATGLGDGPPHDRVFATIVYLKHLYATLPADADVALDRALVFQSEDLPVNIKSASWETMNDWNEITLIPDIYYFHAHGYHGFSTPDITWADREPTMIWRGSTTGLFYQRLEDLDLLPRYKACQIASRLGAAVDVGINSVVQALDVEQEQRITDRLGREGLIKPFIPMPEMARFRYVLDMDGNSNSWNFMMKLRLQSCVLRVDSDWHQWFAPRLRPWEHYVPIAKDLSNLEDRIQWCLDNDAECARIAERGAAFARAMDFDDEMASAARAIFTP